MTLDFVPLDFVTVAFRADLPLLRLQARSMARHLDPALPGQVIVIGNAPGDAALAGDFAREILPEYGALAPRVRWVPGEALADFRGAPRRDSGWRRQQALKLEAHRLVTAPAYVTLDCKNHFIRPAGHDAFLAPDGRLRMAPRDTLPDQMSAFDLFGVPPGRRPAVMFHIVTPFALRTAEVAAMDAALRARTGGGATDALLTDTGPNVFEYRLYCAFLVAERGGWEEHHVLSPLPAATFLARTDRIELFLRHVDHPATVMMAIHRRAGWSPPEHKAEIVRRWLAFGLVADAAEGEAVLTPPPRAHRPP